jgi:hypothetical protein
VYVRFVTFSKHPDSRQELGLLHAVYQLLDEGKLAVYEEEWGKRVLNWLEKNLATPTRFNRSNNIYSSPAISWLKDSAHEHLKNMHELRALLENHGIATKMITTDRPGYVLYEDQFQVTAIPFKNGTF